MSRAEDVLQQIGLNFPVRRWLAEHEGDPDREEIVKTLQDAIDNDFPDAALKILRSKIAMIARDRK